MPVKKTTTPRTKKQQTVAETPVAETPVAEALVVETPVTVKQVKSSTPKVINTHASKSSQTYKKNTVLTDDNQTSQLKPTQKAGRTLLLKSFNGTNVDSTVLEQLTGLVSTTQTKTSQSYFLTFDTIDNAFDALKTLRSASPDYKVKFSYYRSFFTISGLNSSDDYNQVKEDFKKYISENTGANVLFCKFYQKNNEYIGCGDLTVDTLESMNKLLSKEDGIKEYSFGSFKGTFYRYNKKEKDDQHQTSHS